MTIQIPCSIYKFDYLPPLSWRDSFNHFSHSSFATFLVRSCNAVCVRAYLSVSFELVLADCMCIWQCCEGGRHGERRFSRAQDGTGLALHFCTNRYVATLWFIECIITQSHLLLISLSLSLSRFLCACMCICHGSIQAKQIKSSKYVCMSDWNCDL